MLLQSINRNAFILGAFALLSIGLIAVFHHLTKDKIAYEMQAKLARTLNELVDPNRFDNDVYHDCVVISDADSKPATETARIYRMTKQGNPVAVVLNVTANDGYNGVINLIMAINADATIAGVRVINHNETPGLGDKIERKKSDWITRFNGLSLTNPAPQMWQVKQDGGQFDAFTGATITPRAVVKAVRNGLQFYQQHQTSLFTAPNHCEVQHEPT
ncbi:MAG: electron transport complex subunit RsxG [Gammaproteobacteria bacterium]|nr:electron transport complex subunit RsxG [Gammaproteobacteria bacterium]NVK88790.1 electron transport complex subunit RsxG [Gammaproteobacteria bacterium]